MKLDTVVMYDLKICMKELILVPHTKGDNSREIIICL